jgi:hypothetical protein
MDGQSWSLGSVQQPPALGTFKVHATSGKGGVAIHPFGGGQHCFEIDAPRGLPTGQREACAIGCWRRFGSHARARQVGRCIMSATLRRGSSSRR